MEEKAERNRHWVPFMESELVRRRAPPRKRLGLERQSGDRDRPLSSISCGYGVIGRRASLKNLWETVPVQVRLPAPSLPRIIMKSLPYGNLGNRNLRGKKSKAIMAGKYVEDVIHNYKERELIKELNKQMVL